MKTKNLKRTTGTKANTQRASEEEEEEEDQVEKTPNK